MLATMCSSLTVLALVGNYFPESIIKVGTNYLYLIIPKYKYHLFILKVILFEMNYGVFVKVSLHAGNNVFFTGSAGTGEQ